MALPMLMWLGLLTAATRGLRRRPRADRRAAAGLPRLVRPLRPRLAPRPSRSPTCKDLVTFTWYGVAHTWGNVALIPDVGGMLFLLLVATTLLTRPAAPYRLLALSGLAATVATCALIATSRAGLGTGGANAGRYAYFAIAMGVPALAGLVTLVGDLLPSTRERVATAMVLVVVVGLAGAAQTNTFRHSRDDRSQADEAHDPGHRRPAPRRRAPSSTTRPSTRPPPPS